MKKIIYAEGRYKITSVIQDEPGTSRLILFVTNDTRDTFNNSNRQYQGTALGLKKC